MAKSIRTNIGFIFGAVLLGAVGLNMARAQSAQTDYDHTANFGQYHTFSFYKVQTPDPLFVDRVKDEVTRWRFEVEDDGPGIAPRYHERVFVIFQKLEARDKVEGTGIGLALVKKIVEAAGGQVSLASEEGRGATFSFTWPKGDRP